MPTVAETLLEGEIEQYRGTRHWVVLVGPGVVLALGGLIAGIVASRFGWRWAPLVLLITAPPFVYEYALRQACEFVITDRRVIVSTGLATTTVLEVLLTRINGVEIEQTMSGKALGYGTVAIRGFSISDEVLVYLSDPFEFRQEIEKRLAGRRRG